MFSTWIKAERKRRGWSQDDLARRMGVTQGAISHIEKQRRGSNPPYETLRALAGAFGYTTVDEMLVAAGLGGAHPAGDGLADLFRRARVLGVSPQLIDTIERGLPDLPRDIAEDLIAGLRADVAAAEAEREAELDPPAGPHAHGPQPGGGAIQRAAQASAPPYYAAPARQADSHYVHEREAGYCPDPIG